MVIGILKECRRGPFSRRTLEAFSQGSIAVAFFRSQRPVIVAGIRSKSEKNRCAGLRHSRMRLPIKKPGVSSLETHARSRALDSGGQATKGAWGMTRRQEALKGAEDCDKPGVTVKQVMIPGFPNRP